MMNRIYQIKSEIAFDSLVRLLPTDGAVSPDTMYWSHACICVSAWHLCCDVSFRLFCINKLIETII